MEKNSPVFAQRHYRVSELADLWGFSKPTIRKQFLNEPGVLRLASPGPRPYVTLSIPESVALRVHARLCCTAEPVRIKKARPIIRLKDLPNFPK
jgi:hypothetical protein